MAVKGIVIVNAGADRHLSQRALNSLENFSANIRSRDFEALERNQKSMTEQLRERFKRAAEEDATEINYELYARDDGKKSPAKLEGGSILNPTLSKVRAPGRTSSPAECKTCANRRYHGVQSGGNSRAFQPSLPLMPTMAAELVLGVGDVSGENSYAEAEEEHAHYVIDPEELEAYEASRDEDGVPTKPRPQPHLEGVTQIKHVVSGESVAKSHAVHHHHSHGGGGGHAAAVENVSAQLRADICPECGRVYISGIVANTEVEFLSGLDDSNPYRQQLMGEGEADFRGNNVEIEV